MAATATFDIASDLGWPTGVAPFVVVVDRNTNTEEKILCSARTGVTVTVSQRGYDGTAAVDHPAGAKIEHVLDANTIDEANAFVNGLSRWLGPDGTAAAPSLAFGLDPDTGIYRVGENTMGFVTGGVHRVSINDIGQLLGSDGTALKPGISFFNDNDTGIYRGMADRLNFATGGVERLVITNDALTSRTLVRSGDGTAALPSFSFDADPDTGIYREVDGRVSLAGNGVRTAFFQPGLLHLESHGHSIHFGDLNHGIKGTGGGGNSFGGITVNGPVVYGYASVGLGTKQSATELLLYVGTATAFYPQADNAQTLGGSTNRWSTVYAVTGTINTSDEMTKNTIKQTPLGLDFINALAPKRYKFNGGKRMHDGLLAQQVLEAAQSCGVEDLAAYIDPVKGAVKPTRKNFETEEEYAMAVENYKAELAAPKGLRYSELIAPIIRGEQELYQHIKRLEARIEELENA